MVQGGNKISKTKGFNEYKILSEHDCEFYINRKNGQKFIVQVDRDTLDRLIQLDKPWNIVFTCRNYYVKWSSNENCWIVSLMKEGKCLRFKGFSDVHTAGKFAERFGKRHGDILDKISGLIAEIDSTEKSVQYFLPNEYKDLSGKSNKEYILTRDGFTLAVMGFTGAKALAWKLKYIEAFNKMETALKEQNTSLPTTYKAALIQLLEQVEKNELLIEKNKTLTPKQNTMTRC